MKTEYTLSGLSPTKKLFHAASYLKAPKGIVRCVRGKIEQPRPSRSDRPPHVPDTVPEAVYRHPPQPAKGASRLSDPNRTSWEKHNLKKFVFWARILKMEVPPCHGVAPVLGPPPPFLPLFSPYLQKGERPKTKKVVPALVRVKLDGGLYWYRL
ncbi:hypothetical protein JTE90_006332 [Oedothorax gibbosus]|uniref:Uncharacterized protein n=1 Tax=Oedothorax gibbosus TaxID=931172 RepID=A0AAV6TMB8_9ARAC|nr:hypothetical protein JTE90_006332 [Oedothorax gibbosus]